MSVERWDHALVLARITRDKGQDIAARVCLRAGVPLVLAGPVAGIGDPAELERRLADGDTALAAHPDVRYYLEDVAPLVDGTRVVWVGGVAGTAKEQLLQPGATGVVEALVRGVPVIGTPLGVLPSLIQHGVTGYLAETEEELAGYVGQVGSIDPFACRAAASAWSPAAMAEKYLQLYERMIEKGAR
jgi:glycosyltransferase involved in cell wall biosynthesis